MGIPLGQYLQQAGALPQAAQTLPPTVATGPRRTLADVVARSAPSAAPAARSAPAPAIAERAAEQGPGGGPGTGEGPSGTGNARSADASVTPPNGIPSFTLAHAGPVALTVSPLGSVGVSLRSGNPALDTAVNVGTKFTGAPTSVALPGLAVPALSAFTGPAGLASALFNGSIALGKAVTDALGIPNAFSIAKNAQNMAALANDPDPTEAAVGVAHQAQAQAELSAAQAAAAQGLSFSFSDTPAGVEAAQNFANQFNAGQTGNRATFASPHGYVIGFTGHPAMADLDSNMAQLNQAHFGIPAGPRGITVNARGNEFGRMPDPDPDPDPTAADPAGPGPGNTGVPGPTGAPADPSAGAQGGPPGIGGPGPGTGPGTGPPGAVGPSAAPAEGESGGSGGGGGGGGGGSHLCTWAVRLLGKEAETVGLRDSFVAAFAHAYPATWRKDFKEYQQGAKKLLAVLTQQPEATQRLAADTVWREVLEPFAPTIEPEELPGLLKNLERVGFELARQYHVEPSRALVEFDHGPSRARRSLGAGRRGVADPAARPTLATGAV